MQQKKEVFQMPCLSYDISHAQKVTVIFKLDGIQQQKDAK
jgi:hypothetical protein